MMKVRKGLIQLFVLCYLCFQRTLCFQGFPKSTKIQLTGNKEEEMSCREGQVVVITEVKYDTRNPGVQDCHQYRLGLLNAVCLFRTACKLKSNCDKVPEVSKTEINLNCLPKVQLHRGCIIRITQADVERRYGVIANENYPQANNEHECSVYFMLSVGVKIKLTILDCYYTVTIGNTELCNKNDRLPIEKTVSGYSLLKYEQTKRDYEGFLALYTSIQHPVENSEPTLEDDYLAEDTSATSTLTETKTDVSVIATRDSGQKEGVRNSTENKNQGLVIGLVLLVVLVVTAAASCFLYHRWWKPRRKNVYGSRVKYQPPRISFRTLNRNPDVDQAEVMSQPAEPQQYACVGGEVQGHQTGPEALYVNFPVSNSEPKVVSGTDYIVDNGDTDFNYRDNGMHDQTESTQHASVYAAVNKPKARRRDQSDQTCPGNHNVCPVYAAVHKTCYDKPSVCPVSAEDDNACTDKPIMCPVYA